MLNKVKLGKTRILGLALGAFILMGAAGTASAADWYHDCNRRIAHEQRNLDRAIARHGYHSPQADHERHELWRIESECRYR
ncbi:MAG TPA: hypothetical protein VMU43_15040 [Candidatus Acidoferrum sp.]|nr:hypothetical protein [Candidatus Acidoferrum sp.]